MRTEFGAKHLGENMQLLTLPDIDANDYIFVRKLIVGIRGGHDVSPNVYSYNERVKTKVFEVYLLCEMENIM
jgi:hypothetical protein